MDAEFWLERWREGRTHFHQTRVTPLLQKYWPGLDVPAGGRCWCRSAASRWTWCGWRRRATKCWAWSWRRSRWAVLRRERTPRPVIHESSYGRHYVAGNIEIICGDIYNLDARILSHCVGAYDRAALVALPESMRASYVRHVYGQLSPSWRGLLITLDYPQEEMAGPPFSIADSEAQALFRAWRRPPSSTAATSWTRNPSSRPRA